MLAAAALVLGLGVGWLFWGKRQVEPKASPVSEGSSGAAPPTTEPEAAPSAPLDQDQLAGIERELSEARALLEDGEEELRLFGAELDELDAVIRRAGARLHSLFREIRQHALGKETGDGDD